jgi:hypothetical protein
VDCLGRLSWAAILSQRGFAVNKFLIQGVNEKLSILNPTAARNSFN